jgi:hypothetical protein
MMQFTIPPDIRLKDLNKPGEVIEGEKGLVSFRAHSYSRWLSDPRWYTPIIKLSRLAKVQIACEAEPGTVVTLEDQDYQALLDIVKAPEIKLMSPNPLVEAQLLPFYKAVENAREAVQEAPRASKN